MPHRFPRLRAIRTYPPLPQFVLQLWTGQRREEDDGGDIAGGLVWRRPDSPVLHNPVLLPPAVHAVAHQQHGVVDVFTVTVGVIVNT